MRLYSLILFLLLEITYSIAAQGRYAFRIYLKDKGTQTNATIQPEKYLSQAAIERRKKLGIQIAKNDLPISKEYYRTFSELNLRIVTSSKWFSTIVVEANDSVVVNHLKTLPMVDSVKFVWRGTSQMPSDEEKVMNRYYLNEPILIGPYGYADTQIRMLGGKRLHEAGFRGKNVKVAVLDAGFSNVDKIDAFDSLNLIGTYNVMRPESSVFKDSDHGTKVLSCLAANYKGVMIGTAPEASYLLIKCEDERSEYPIEEDYWVAAMEYADSMGVDVVTSSLGYFEFDDKTLSYKHNDLDGKTALISKAATLAAEKGLLVFVSAGNEGDNPWEKIAVPADSEKVLTVGAVDEERQKSSFSSVGFTADNRVKPDVMAMGTACCVIDSRGRLQYVNGTSFSTPILAGLGVCLLQAFPSLSPQKLIEIIKKSSSRYKRPNREYGFGVPNMYKAYKKAKKYDAK